MYSEYLSPSSTPSRLHKSPKSASHGRGRREPSGVFSLFQTAQIQQFKEAFSLIDQDGDGIVNESDLKSIFASLGITPSKQTLENLLNSRPGTSHKFPVSAMGIDADELKPTGGGRGVNFTMFLTMMGEHLFEFDTETELIEAFECFDENDTGMVKASEFRKWLSDSGDRMDNKEIDQLLKGPFTDRQGNFNYREWVKVLTINAEEDEPEK